MIAWNLNFKLSFTLSVMSSWYQAVIHSRVKLKLQPKLWLKKKHCVGEGVTPVVFISCWCKSTIQLWWRGLWLQQPMSFALILVFRCRVKGSLTWVTTYSRLEQVWGLQISAIQHGNVCLHLKYNPLKYRHSRCLHQLFISEISGSSVG